MGTGGAVCHHPTDQEGYLSAGILSGSENIAGKGSQFMNPSGGEPLRMER